MHKEEKKAPPKFKWYSQNMGAKIDISDKEALYRILNQDEFRKFEFLKVINPLQ